MFVTFNGAVPSICPGHNAPSTIQDLSNSISRAQAICLRGHLRVLVIRRDDIDQTNVDSITGDDSRAKVRSLDQYNSAVPSHRRFLFLSPGYSMRCFSNTGSACFVKSIDSEALFDGLVCSGASRAERQCGVEMDKNASSGVVRWLS